MIYRNICYFILFMISVSCKNQYTNYIDRNFKYVDCFVEEYNDSISVIGIVPRESKDSRSNESFQFVYKRSANSTINIIKCRRCFNLHSLGYDCNQHVKLKSDNIKLQLKSKKIDLRVAIVLYNNFENDSLYYLIKYKGNVELRKNNFKYPEKGVWW